MIALLGTVGVPASYGGFETLAENLVRYHHAHALNDSLHVYCSGRAYAEQRSVYLSAMMHYVPLSANGVQSIPYDIWSLFSAVFRGSDRILLLGVSGAVVLPILRLLSRVRIVTNIDGIEWRREKWRGAAKRFLRFSERIAVRYSHDVVADNEGIADYVRETYRRNCHVIAYGGDHAVQIEPKPYEGSLPDRFAFALCRIEPENNVEMILEALSRQTSVPLVFVGNWDNSAYGKGLRERFCGLSHLHLLNPIYDVGVLRYLRERALLYVHGHSAGGTNPSLVEMMHFGVPVAAFDCVFNRYTTDGKAWYFANPDQLVALVTLMSPDKADENGAAMYGLAQERYTWDAIGAAYFRLLNSEHRE